MPAPLPIDAALPELITALRDRGRAVLEAPPGAGKTTRVPLAMLEAGLTQGRIVVLEPRRLAARAAAERMAQTLGEPVGDTVGYRIRGESRVGPATRIEVVTEGILTRMLQSAPDLPGVGAVIFDEFHERSLNADLGLALCLEVAGALRDDLMLLAMSATLDAGPVAELMEAPVIRSEGRAYPVETRWLDRPLPARTRRDTALVDLVVQAEAETDGGILVFLPGEGEIRRAETAIQSRLPATCQIRPLYGALPFARQRAAIAPVEAGRKVVLATSIAETSLTIEDIRVVVDIGLARRARFDPGSGMSRLVTERVTRAEAIQRQGRAGRVAEGACYRLWTKGEDGALAAHPPSEIEAADLASLALELALWGASATDLPFLLEEGRALEHGLVQEVDQVVDPLPVADDRHRRERLPVRRGRLGQPGQLVHLDHERVVGCQRRIEGVRHPDLEGRWLGDGDLLGSDPEIGVRSQDRRDEPEECCEDPHVFAPGCGGVGWGESCSVCERSGFDRRAKPRRPPDDGSASGTGFLARLARRALLLDKILHEDLGPLLQDRPGLREGGHELRKLACREG